MAQPCRVPLPGCAARLCGGHRKRCCIWHTVARAGRCSFAASAHSKPVGAVASTVGFRADCRVLPAALSASHLFSAKGANIVCCCNRLLIYGLDDNSISRKLFAKLPLQHCSGCGACRLLPSDFETYGSKFLEETNTMMHWRAQAAVTATTFLKTRMGLGTIDAARPYLCEPPAKLSPPFSLCPVLSQEAAAPVKRPFRVWRVFTQCTRGRCHM